MDRIVSHNKLSKFTREVFKKGGMDEWGAYHVASHLVSANLRGIDSHGVSRIPLYLDRIKKGYVNPGTKTFIEVDEKSYTLIDGDNKSGIVVAQTAIEKAVEKAFDNGVSVVGVKNSNHFGMLAYYGKYACKHDCIAIITSNASPSMPPIGGKKRFFGTGPLCYAIPAGEEDDIIGDMATSVVARGKIRLAAKNHEVIPDEWALNKEGEPTTDPIEALEGMVLPMAGPKGYALNVLMESLSSVLTGAAVGPNAGAITDPKPQQLGHFFLTIKPDIFMGLDDFKKRVDQMIRDIKSTPKNKNTKEIYLPGEIENNKERERLTKGIPISKQVYKEIIQIGKKLNVAYEI